MKKGKLKLHLRNKRNLENICTGPFKDQEQIKEEKIQIINLKAKERMRLKKAKCNQKGGFGADMIYKHFIIAHETCLDDSKGSLSD